MPETFEFVGITLLFKKMPIPVGMKPMITKKGKRWEGEGGTRKKNCGIPPSGSGAGPQRGKGAEPLKDVVFDLSDRQN